jgi:Na+-transporting NADH:ubiquinone oxidoreductase subunit NqrC
MLSIIFGIIIAGSNMLLEYYQERRRDYLRNKQMKIELERMEKQHNGKI